ncbi:MAG: histidine kinase dimerization/phospho-acceptor domain-containing protein, partial [Dehalococcoidia bacterium]
MNDLKVLPEDLHSPEELKKQILSTVSYELRTPLASIKGFSTLMLDYDTRLKRREKREYLQAIDRAADRLTDLVDGLLDVSRLETGLRHMDSKPDDVSLITWDVLSLVSAKATGPGTAGDHPNGDTPEGVTADITARRELEEDRERLLKAYQEQAQVIAASYLDLEKAMARVQETEEELQQLYERERGLRQELEAEIKRRAEFTRALVHELKTPLTPVLASSDILLGELHEEPFLSLARNINQGASNLNNRIDELLDLSRGEIGMLRLNPRPVD